MSENAAIFINADGRIFVNFNYSINNTAFHENIFKGHSCLKSKSSEFCFLFKLFTFTLCKATEKIRRKDKVTMLGFIASTALLNHLKQLITRCFKNI